MIISNLLQPIEMEVYPGTNERFENYVHGHLALARAIIFEYGQELMTK